MPAKRKNSAGPGAGLGDKTVMITGGARRVGAALARKLHAAGANIVLHFRRSGRDATALINELNEARRDSAVTVQADLLEVSRFHDLIEAATKAFGQLDVLVNNASSFYPTPVGEITEADWNDLLGSNLKAPLFLS